MSESGQVQPLQSPQFGGVNDEPLLRSVPPTSSAAPPLMSSSLASRAAIYSVHPSPLDPIGL